MDDKERKVAEARMVSDVYEECIRRFTANTTQPYTEQELSSIRTILNILPKEDLQKNVLELLFRYKSRQLGAKCLCECHFFNGFFHCFSGDCCREPNFKSV